MDFASRRSSSVSLRLFFRRAASLVLIWPIAMNRCSGCRVNEVSDYRARSSADLPGAGGRLASRGRRARQPSGSPAQHPRHVREPPMNEAYLRPRKILDAFSRLYPEAWRQVDELRANRKGLGGWPDWCFMPLAGAHAIVSKGTTLRSIDQARHVGILGALAAWRVTQGIYRFDPTTFDALWETPVTGDIPTEVLFHLPEWCVYIPTPDRRWRGDTLHGFFAHLEHDANDRRTELRFLLDLTKPEGDDLLVLPLHLGQGGVSEGVAAMMHEAARHLPVRAEPPDSEIEGLSQ